MLAVVAKPRPQGILGKKSCAAHMSNEEDLGMKTGRGRLVLVVAILVSVLAVPSAAIANGFFIERGLWGISFGQTYDTPDLSGGNVIFSEQPAPGSLWAIWRFNIASGSTTLVHSEPALNQYGSRVSGDWVVWHSNSDIKAKNIKTGAFKDVTADAAAKADAAPEISGTYVVWMSWDGSTWDVKGKNLAAPGSPLNIADGAGNQSAPAIYGDRVAYIDDVSGHANVLVKTIGSSAAPKKITDNAVDQTDPSIGDHLVAWLVHNGTGKDMIRYYDYNTGLTYDGPSNATYDMINPQVSGDRILYHTFLNASDADLYVFDTRIAKTNGSLSAIRLASTGDDEKLGMISGDEVVFIAGASPYWGKLAAPGISLSAVPTRIAHGGHIHLKGYISDQGHRIGSATLGIERYSSGKWTLIKTLTASSTGTFSYQTPKTYSKTPYRVVYDGRIAFASAAARNHLSAVSVAKTAWPR
jgi:hypothetical protein